MLASLWQVVSFVSEAARELMEEIEAELTDHDPFNISEFDCTPTFTYNYERGSKDVCKRCGCR